jgi:hypothetical protein
VEDGYSRLEELRDECQEVVDTAPESLSGSQRIQTMGETADQLSGADDPPEVPEALGGVVVCFTEDRRKSKSHSRVTRCAEAVSLLYAAKEAVEEWLADNAQSEAVEEVQSMIDSIDDLISSAESCEFPGMFG